MLIVLFHCLSLHSDDRPGARQRIGRSVVYPASAAPIAVRILASCLKFVRIPTVDTDVNSLMTDVSPTLRIGLDNQTSFLVAEIHKTRRKKCTSARCDARASLEAYPGTLKLVV